MSYQFGIELPVNAGNKSRNTGIYTQTLFGQDIHQNPVPTWTANKEHHPFVVFEDPQNSNRIGINREMLSCGFITIAEPGGGKTNLLNMITARLLATQGENDKIIIFDTKGDYYKEFGSRISPKNRIVIGTGSEYQNIVSYHNLFSEIMPRGNDGKLVYTEEVDADALEKAKQLYADMQSETQPIFPSMAEQIIAGLFIYFIRTYWKTNQSKLNNKEFIQLVSGSSNEELKKIFELDYMKDYRNCASYISGKGNQTQGVNSYIGTVLRELFVGVFANSNPQREFSMREVVESSEGKKVIFVEYDLRRGEILKPMYGLLLDSALSNALGGRQTNRNNVYFVLDEMLLLPELRHLSNGLNFGRSQGVKILCGLQNISGLADAYGEIGAKRILASFQNLVAFQNSDYDTRQFLMERLGRNYQNTSFSAQQENINIQREGYIVEDWDILSLKLGEAIISLKDEKPFLFTMPKYR
ncbi:MAG: type IV secretion system DNA-binding domain-containing protein [Eubacteriales bacterium]